ncbi:MAG: ATP-binding cassette domain-containing protein, partial [Acidobacteriales bacterium]|nr:ATP-binding cassette domain-containing protein [Terriglobales bacterium]
MNAAVGDALIYDWDVQLECRNVSFCYRGEAAPVFRGLSFVIQPGERWAIVGPSGVGKTSLLRLLLKLEQPSEGAILVAGESLSEISSSEWAKKIGVVFQGNTLFSGSVRENIAFGYEHIDDDRMQWAAWTACVHADILSLPMGFETRLEDRGGQLSA